MWKLFVPVAVLIGLVLGMLALDKPRPRADFAFINRGDLSTLDLSRMSWMQDLRVAACLWEGLVRNDVLSKDFGKLPGVAEKWELSDDQRTWTFHLRANAKWSNGEAVTAKDFIYAWRRGLLPDTAGDYMGLFQLIQGGEAFSNWRAQATAAFAKEASGAERPAEANALWQQTLARFDEMVGLKAVDDRTLKVTLERPVPYFLDVVAMEFFGPLYGRIVDEATTVDSRTGLLKTRADWTKPGVLVTNGPFQLVTWRLKREVRLETNPHYWDTSRLAIDSISMPSVEDKNAAVVAFQTGAVDWVSDVTADYRGELLEAKRQFYREHQTKVDALRAQGLGPIEIDLQLPRDVRKNVHSFPAMGTYFYNFNCNPKLNDGRVNPFADARVRRAFAMTIDKAHVADNVRRLGEKVTGSLTPAGSIAGYTPPAGVPFDPEGARKLLAEAGYPGGEGFITVEILVNRDAGHDVIAQAIKKDWEKHLGVKVVVDQVEIKIFRQELKQQNFMVTRAGWFADYGDPLTFLDLSRSTDGNNDRKYNNPAFDAMLDRANNEPDPAKRLKLLEDAERFIVEEALPMAPIFHYVQIYLFDPHRVSGISTHPRQKQYMHLVKVNEDR
jgi:oligopeptide transport system substrate-binding protein